MSNTPQKTPYTKADFISAAKIRAYMFDEIQDHVDPLTGEVNITTLAEDACQHFNGYEHDKHTHENDAIPEKFFDIAFQVGERHEIRTGVKEGSPNGFLRGLINSRSSRDL